MRYIVAILSLSVVLFACNKTENSKIKNPQDTIEAVKPIPVVTGKLNYLQKYEGKISATDKFYESEPLQTMLKEILANDWQSFPGSMQFADSLKSENNIFYSVSKFPAKSKKDGFAFILIDPAKEQIHFSVVVGTMRYEYQKKDTRITLPKELSSMMTSRGLITE